MEGWREQNSGRMAALVLDASAKQEPPRRPAHRAARSMRAGVLRPRVSRTRLPRGWRGLLASRTAAPSQSPRASAGGNGLGPFPRRWVPARPAAQGLAVGTLVFLAAARPARRLALHTLASQVPPSPPGPPHLHGGPWGGTLRPQCHEETSGLPPSRR